MCCRETSIQLQIKNKHSFFHLLRASLLSCPLFSLIQFGYFLKVSFVGEARNPKLILSDCSLNRGPDWMVLRAILIHSLFIS